MAKTAHGPSQLSQPSAPDRGKRLLNASATFTIANRELSSLFYSPIAYVVMGIFGVYTSVFFVLVFYGPDATASITDLLRYPVYTLMIFLAPALSMRLLSEEFGRGTIETLMTAPVSDTQVVVGKYLGALAFLAVLLLWLALPMAMLEMAGTPEYMPMISGIFGLLMVGGLFLAIGTLASSLSSNQIIAFILTLFMIAPLVLIDVLSYRVALMPMPEWLRQGVYYLSVNSQFEHFNRGLVDVSNFTYFLTGIPLFLFLAVLVLQSRRWR